ncbi:UPF0764 protein C16orf89 -like protein [Halotydeus destructor]|nr:UPF0764 protein C16orf89 -like protein [Halotydeus destructor]
MFRQLLFVLLVNQLCAIDMSDGLNHEQDFGLIIKATQASASALEFLDQVKDRLNIDSLIGVRIFADQADQLVRHISKLPRPNFGTFMVNSLVDLGQQAVDLIGNSLPFIENKDGAYFREVANILQPGLWAHWADHWSRVKPSLVSGYRIANYENIMTENVSDLCVSQLINDNCKVSRDCWNLMTQSGFGDYQLSHQVFYLAIGIKANCRYEMDKTAILKGQVSVDHLVDEFCANMFAINQDIVSNGLRHDDRDLFMENSEYIDFEPLRYYRPSTPTFPVAFCGLLGYSDFMEDRHWLEAIVQWQQDTGCYGTDATIRERINKRREDQLTDTCLGHETSMALGALAANIRFLLIS